jgi:hypothetical protein
MSISDFFSLSEENWATDFCLNEQRIKELCAIKSAIANYAFSQHIHIAFRSFLLPNGRKQVAFLRNAGREGGGIFFYREMHLYEMHAWIETTMYTKSRIPLGMLLSVETAISTHTLHSVGMQPIDNQIHNQKKHLTWQTHSHKYTFIPFLRYKIECR